MDGFVSSAAGPVPRVRTRLLPSDHLGTARVRIGYNRAGYKVVPGLYCVGDPTPDSPVLVTANYKLTFDAVRSRLSGVNAWILVVDTRGINVWCAAGKNLFATHEVVLSVNSARLQEVTSHRQLILPQLGATGVSAAEVRRRCGFSVVFGPVRADDIPEYLGAGNQATEAMRTVTFPLSERLTLIPVEIFLLWKLLAWTMVGLFILSGIGPDVFSLSDAWHRGLTALGATVTGIVTGCGLVPLLLNRLPWRQFWPKGALTGLVTGTGYALFATDSAGFLPVAAIILWSAAVSSYMAMNFTGSTPYTSPSGVEREMRVGIPLQAAAAGMAVLGWLAAPFMV